VTLSTLSAGASTCAAPFIPELRPLMQKLCRKALGHSGFLTFCVCVCRVEVRSALFRSLRQP
jgi:hypothetical protein